MKMNRLSVLVVEDDALVRMGILAALEDAGFETIGAENAADAMQHLAERLPSVLFTDIDMPGPMNGIGLAETVRDRWPLIQIVMTSGHFRMMACPMPKVFQYVSKPYDAGEVAATMRDMVMAA